MKPEYEIVWDGSKTFNRGYLNLPSDIPTAPPAREDLSGRFPADPERQTLIAQIVTCLEAKPHTARDLERATHAKQSPIATCLGRLRREGRLRNKKATAPDGVKHWVNYYWLEQ